MQSSSMSCKHSTAKRNQPCAKAAKQVCADQSATTQVSRQSWREPTCRWAFVQLATFSKRTKKSNSAREVYVTTQKAAVKLVWCAKDLPLLPVPIRYNTALSLRPFYEFRTCMRRPGCFCGAWSSWIFATRQFAPKIVDLSVRVIRFLFHVFFLVSKRNGGNSIIGVRMQ